MALAGPPHPWPGVPRSRPLPARAARAPPEARALSPPAESLRWGFSTLPKPPTSKKTHVWGAPAAPRPRPGSAAGRGRSPGLEGFPQAEHSSLSERLNSSAGRNQNCPEPQASPVTELVDPLAFPSHCFTR